MIPSCHPSGFASWVRSCHILQTFVVFDSVGCWFTPIGDCLDSSLSGRGSAYDWRQSLLAFRSPVSLGKTVTVTEVNTTAYWRSHEPALSVTTSKCCLACSLVPSCSHRCPCIDYPYSRVEPCRWCDSSGSWAASDSSTSTDSVSWCSSRKCPPGSLFSDFTRLQYSSYSVAQSLWIHSLLVDADLCPTVFLSWTCETVWTQCQWQILASTFAFGCLLIPQFAGFGRICHRQRWAWWYRWGPGSQIDGSTLSHPWFVFDRCCQCLLEWTARQRYWSWAPVFDRNCLEAAVNYWTISYLLCSVIQMAQSRTHQDLSWPQLPYSPSQD